MPFGYGCAWLAVRGAAPGAVAEAVGLNGLRPAGWPEGVSAAYDGAVFVSPALHGWVLAASTAFPAAGAGDPGGGLAPWLAGLSGRLGTEVQYFASRREAPCQAWARAEGGRVVRAFAWSGERGGALVDLGRPTPEEVRLGLAGRGAAEPPGEREVMRLAGAWSLDPTRLGERPGEAGPGWLGEL